MGLNVQVKAGARFPNRKGFPCRKIKEFLRPYREAPSNGRRYITVVQLREDKQPNRQYVWV